MPNPFRGAIVAPYLPFDAAGRLKEQILARHVDNILDAGPQALYCLGEVEEFAAMPVAQRVEIAEALVAMVRNRVPVAIQVGTPSLRETIRLAVHAEEIGASAVYCVPPYYYPLDELGLEAFFTELARSVKIPVHLYNTPECTKVKLQPALLQRLGRIANVTAMKDSSGDLVLMQETIQTAGIDVFVGGEPLHLPGLLVGAASTVSGSAGVVFPELPVRLWQAVERGELKAAMRLQSTLTAVTRCILSRHPNWPLLVKESIRIRSGLDMGSSLVGYSALDVSESAHLERAFKQLGLM